MSDDDIVERLRLRAKAIEGGDNSRDAGLMREAAMSIERLRSLAGMVTLDQSCFADIKRVVGYDRRGKRVVELIDTSCGDRAPSADAQS